MLDLAQHLQRQKEFSLKTFGPGRRTVGILEHIKQEIEEVLEEPLSLEWVDIAILALDGAWRAGFTPEQIAQAFEDKQTKNESRKWPDWKHLSEDEPSNHIK